MSADLSTIANLLQASLDPRQNKQGKSLPRTTHHRHETDQTQ
jgi:hypothetical protein